MESATGKQSIILLVSPLATTLIFLLIRLPLPPAFTGLIILSAALGATAAALAGYYCFNTMVRKPLLQLDLACRMLEQGELRPPLNRHGVPELRSIARRLTMIADHSVRQQAVACHEEQQDLATELSSRLSMIERLFVQREQAFIGAVRALISAVEANDPYTHGHSERVTRYCLAIAERLGLDKKHHYILEKAGLLHDIGKIGVDKSILHKQGKLEEHEMAIMQRHPEIGSSILMHIDNLEDVRQCVIQHHERFDGCGYPHGIGGERLMIEARILAVADTYDAMTSDRPYRKGLPQVYAFEELRNNAGSQFDPQVVGAFLEVMACDMLSAA